MFSIYQKKEEEKERNAFKFKMKNSLVSKFTETLQNPAEVEFCKEVIAHFKRVQSETEIIPYSVATINPDNGLRERVPTTYNEHLDTQSITIAKQMVRDLKEKASEAGKYESRIQEEIK